jgi:2-polyprenyl-3-methyl-5-hydroxy-6-metoxy-1,4-benzoquinol methylase
MQESTKLTHRDQISVVEVPRCPACDGVGDKLYGELRDRLYNAPGVWSLSRCTSCRSLWLNPRPHDNDISKCYAEYFTHVASTETAQVNGAWNAVKDAVLFGRKREARFYGAMFLLKDPPGRLLDVGCGDGSFLDSMRKLGWKVTGFEFDPKAALIARERFDLEVFVGQLEDISFSTNFDAITLSHVIEHVPDPRALLRRCFQLLTDGGKLAITTPNVRSIGHFLFRRSWRGLEPPRHLVLFSPESLRSILEEVGFEVLKYGTSDRTASGMFAASSQLRLLEESSTRSSQSFPDTLIRIVYVFVQHWGKSAIRNIGEETGILARKKAKDCA